MAKRIVQPIFFTGGEFQHCRRALNTIAVKAENLEQIFQAAGKRSADEFKQAMAIIRGLPPENEGGAR